MKLYEILDGKRKEKMFSCIYLWTNLVNNKKYVGQAQYFYQRMQHYKSKGATPFLQNAINKYGIDNFDIIVLEKCSVDKLDEREQYWMDFYKSYNKENGYNICQYASTTRGYKYTEEVKQKIQETKSQRVYQKPFKELNGMYGKHHTKEALQKISESSKKLWQNQEYRRMQSERMSGEKNYFYNVHMYGELNPRYGKHCTEETKEKIASKLRGKPNLACSIPIICLETNKIYSSMTVVAKELNTYASAIKIAVDNPNRTCKGYHFSKIS